MKKIILIFGLMLWSSCFFGQDELNKSIDLKLKDLEIPTSPGFMFLDKAPTSIESPKSSKALVLSVINSFESNNGFPQDYSIEITPFWFLKNKNMTALKYMGLKKRKDNDSVFTLKQNYFSNPFKNTSFSFAFTTAKDSITDKDLKNISFGLRTNILAIRSRKNLNALSLTFNKMHKALQSVMEGMPSQPLPTGDDSVDDENHKSYLKKLEEYQKNIAYKKELKGKTDGSDLVLEKPLFTLDVAMAYNSFYIDNDFSTNQFGRFGAWMSMSFSKSISKSENYINLYGVARYLRDGTEQQNGSYIEQDLYDFGGKLEFEFKKIAVSYEYIHRITDFENTHRSNGVVKYKISDKLYLTGAFGKNFGEENNLISFLGVNWGFASGKEEVTIKAE